jgi:hypothetical protein
MALARAADGVWHVSSPEKDSGLYTARPFVRRETTKGCSGLDRLRIPKAVPTRPEEVFTVPARLPCRPGAVRAAVTRSAPRTAGPHFGAPWCDVTGFQPRTLALRPAALRGYGTPAMHCS